MSRTTSRRPKAVISCPMVIAGVWVPPSCVPNPTRVPQVNYRLPQGQLRHCELTAERPSVVPGCRGAPTGRPRAPLFPQGTYWREPSAGRAAPVAPCRGTLRAVRSAAGAGVCGRSSPRPAPPRAAVAASCDGAGRGLGAAAVRRFPPGLSACERQRGGGSAMRWPRGPRGAWRLLPRRSLLAVLFLFSLSSSFLYFVYVAPGIVNTYLFMMQAQGIMIRENMRTIGAQVYEQVVRSAYAKRNSSVNDSDYPLDLNHNETFLQATTFLPEDFTYFPNHTCPERLPSMKGPIDVNMSEITMEDIHQFFSKDPSIKLGGHWKPSDCLPRWKVAILIPFRNRYEHLPVLFRHLIPMLQRQRLQFAFYVVEQAGTQPFNRAMLFNVGFREAMKDLDWDCLIFHDVDHIPENDRNYYGCGQMPRHFAAKLDKYMYLLPYNEFFGGVSGLTVEQFWKINGFPNAFWGWGGEDDDLWNRVQYAGYSVTRPEGDTGKYKSIPHHHRGEVQFLGRYALLRKSKERQALDGLNNLNYFPNVTYDALYKNITVNLTPELALVTEY
uniref:glucosylceramide beta-1,4-galactosyltransferase n=3 Tax=Coturnix japonica TaxID=93934 RepID=A0A8C2T6B7_COTJA